MSCLLVNCRESNKPMVSEAIYRGRPPGSGNFPASTNVGARAGLRIQPARCHQTGLVSEYDHLRSVASVELRHRARDVCSGGCRTDEQLLCDLIVREPSPDQSHNLSLALSQIGQ